MVDIDLGDLRAFRASAEAQSRREHIPQIKLCDAPKVTCGEENANGFHRQNPIGRPAHAM
jgi:hypothetical protein